MKDTVLIDMDGLLKQTGATIKKVHERSIDIEDPLQDYWGQLYDQLAAHLTLLIATRADIVAALKLSADKQRSMTNEQGKEPVCQSGETSPIKPEVPTNIGDLDT